MASAGNKDRKQEIFFLMQKIWKLCSMSASDKCFRVNSLLDKAEVEILFIAEHFQVCGITVMYTQSFARLTYKQWGQ